MRTMRRVSLQRHPHFRPNSLLYTQRAALSLNAPWKWDFWIDTAQKNDLDVIQNALDKVMEPHWTEKMLDTPVTWVADALEIVHFAVGLPWWMTIAGTAIVTRIAIFPILLMNARQFATIHQARPVSKLIMDEYKLRRANGSFADNTESIQFLKAHMANIVSRLDLRMWKFILYPAVLLSTSIPFVFAARRIVRRFDHDLAQGGISWFQDLSLADPHMILPFSAIFLTYGVIAYGLPRVLDAPSTSTLGMFSWAYARVMFALQCFELSILPVVVDLPAGYFCYWIPFATFGLMSKFALVSPSISQWLGIHRKRTGELADKNPAADALLREYTAIFRRVSSSRPSSKTGKKSASRKKADQTKLVLAPRE